MKQEKSLGTAVVTQAGDDEMLLESLVGGPLQGGSLQVRLKVCMSV